MILYDFYMIAGFILLLEVSGKIKIRIYPVFHPIQQDKFGEIMS
jgi:hypothetical protein